MSEWPRYPASELSVRGVLRVEDGNHGEYRPRSTEFGKRGVAYIRAADMSARGIDFRGASKISETAVQRITKGIGKPYDVLLSHKGTVGKVAVAPRDAPAFVCSPQTTFWRSLDPDVLDSLFLAYYMSSPDFVRQLDSRKGETDMAAYVSLTEQRKLKILLPPVAVQQRIAATLGVLDDKIASNRRCVRLLVELAQAGLLGGPQQVRLGDIATLDKGVSYKGSGLVDRLSDSARPLVNLGNFPVDSGWLNRSKTKFYSGDYRDRHVVHAGDLVVANTDLTHQRAVLGRAALVPADSGPSLISHHVFVVRFHACHELRLPLWAQLTTPSARERLIGYATGTTVAGLPREALLDFRVSVPTSSEVTVLAEALVASAWARENETALLVALRDTLLPELLSGRLRVPEAGEAVDQALA